MIVLSTSLEVGPIPDGGVAGVPSRAKELLRGWVLAWYSRRGNVEFTVPEGVGRVEPTPGHFIQISESHSADGGELWTLTWVRPDEHDASLNWSASAVIAQRGEQAEINLVLRVDPREFQVRPVRISLRSPRVVRSLVRELPCSLGGRPVTAECLLIAAAEVARFVATELRDTRRRLPCVVVSPRSSDGMLAVNPTVLAEYLAGLAEVYILEDRWATYELTDELTRAQSCFDGSVRVYWPGFGSPDDSVHHPYFTSEELTRSPPEERDGELKIFRMVAQRAASRAAPGGLARALEAAIVEERRQSQRASVDRLQAQIAKGIADKEVLSQKLNELLVERDEALRLLELERGRREASERQIATLSAMAGADVLAEEVSAPETVEEAVMQAERRFGDDLIVTDVTRRSAAESPYRNPQRVLHALEALADLSRLYYAEVDPQADVGPLEEFFRKRGAIDYSPAESTVTMGRFGRERAITYDGQTLTLVRHLTLGGGSRENCLQVYWEFFPAKRKILVGHCGLHLEYAGHRT